MNSFSTIYLEQKGSFVKLADGIDPGDALTNAIKQCSQCLDQLALMLHDSIRAGDDIETIRKVPACARSDIVANMREQELQEENSIRSETA